MSRNTDSQPACVRPCPKRHAAARTGRRIVRKIAQSTLLAAGLAVSQLGIPEMDSRFKVFDPSLVDRLQAPITRYHE